MQPVLFHLGSVTIYTYGVLVCLAFLIGTIWIVARAKHAGENPETYLELMFWLIVGSFVGARLWYVLYYPEFYLAHPLNIVLDRGGLVWYGGVIGGSLAAFLFSRVRQLSFLKIGDIYALPATLGLAIGRVGCFFSGCCYGKSTTMPWGVVYPAGHITHPLHVHPVQLYETALLLALLGVLAILQKQPLVAHHTGRLLGAFLMGISVIRFGLEYLRADGIFWVAQLLTASQLISLFGLALGVMLFFQLGIKRTLSPKSL